MVSRPSIVLVKKIYYNFKMNSSDFAEWKHDIYVKIFTQETEGVGVMSDLVEVSLHIVLAEQGGMNAKPFFLIR